MSTSMRRAQSTPSLRELSQPTSETPTSSPLPPPIISTAFTSATPIPTTIDLKTPGGSEMRVTLSPSATATIGPWLKISPSMENITKTEPPSEPPKVEPTASQPSSIWSWLPWGSKKQIEVTEELKKPLLSEDKKPASADIDEAWQVVPRRFDPLGNGLDPLGRVVFVSDSLEDSKEADTVTVKYLVQTEEGGPVTSADAPTDVDLQALEKEYVYLVDAGFSTREETIETDILKKDISSLLTPDHPNHIDFRPLTPSELKSLSESTRSPKIEGSLFIEESDEKKLMETVTPDYRASWTSDWTQVELGVLVNKTCGLGDLLDAKEEFAWTPVELAGLVNKIYGLEDLPDAKDLELAMFGPDTNTYKGKGESVTRFKLKNTSKEVVLYTLAAMLSFTFALNAAAAAGNYKLAELSLMNFSQTLATLGKLSAGRQAAAFLAFMSSFFTNTRHANVFIRSTLPQTFKKIKNIPENPKLIFTLFFAACAGIPAGQIGKESSPDDILSWWNGISTGSSILLGRIYGIDAFLERVRKWMASPNKKVSDIINLKTFLATLGSAIVGSVYAHKFGKALNIFSKGGYYPLPKALTTTLDFALGGTSTFILYIDRVSSLPDALRTAWRTRFGSEDVPLKLKIMCGVDLICGLSSGLTGLGLLQSSTQDPDFGLSNILPDGSVQAVIAGYFGGTAVGGLNAAVSLRSYHGASTGESLSGYTQNYTVFGYKGAAGSFESAPTIDKDSPTSLPAADHPSHAIPSGYARQPSLLLAAPSSPRHSAAPDTPDSRSSMRLVDSP